MIRELTKYHFIQVAFEEAWLEASVRKADNEDKLIFAFYAGRTATLSFNILCNPYKIGVGSTELEPEWEHISTALGVALSERVAYLDQLHQRGLEIASFACAVSTNTLTGETKNIYFPKTEENTL